MSYITSLARLSVIVGLASAASRILGFIRDILIAQVLGAGIVADAFLIAFRIPSAARRIMSEGGINAGFIPIYGRILATEGSDEANAFAGRTLQKTIVWLTIITVIAELFSEKIVYLLASGFTYEEEKLALATWYTQLALPFVAFTGVACFLSAFLNANRLFIAAAIAPVCVNALLICSLLLSNNWLNENLQEGFFHAGSFLATSISISGLLHLIIVSLAVQRLPTKTLLFASFGKRAPQRSYTSVYHLLRFAIPAVIASAMTQIILLAATAVASSEPSAVSWFYYADRVFQLPLSFISIAAGVVLLPEFIYGRDDGSNMASSLTRFFTNALAIALPAAVGLITLAPTIISVLFERGAFTSIDSAPTSWFLIMLATALPAAAISKVLIQPFFAEQRVSVPLISGIIGIMLTLLIAHLMIHANFIIRIGIATSVGLWAQALFLIIYARDKIIWSLTLAKQIMVLIISALIMSFFIMRLDETAAYWLAMEQPTFQRFFLLAGLCIMGILIYGASVILLSKGSSLRRHMPNK